jgi:hypothetical protein
MASERKRPEPDIPAKKPDIQPEPRLKKFPQIRTYESASNRAPRRRQSKRLMDDRFQGNRWSHAWMPIRFSENGKFGHRAKYLEPYRGGSKFGADSQAAFKIARRITTKCALRRWTYEGDDLATPHSVSRKQKLFHFRRKFSDREWLLEDTLFGRVELHRSDIARHV